VLTGVQMESKPRFFAWAATGQRIESPSCPRLRQ